MNKIFQYLIANAEVIFTACCSLFIISFVFWPLLNSIASILIVACWLFLMPKSRMLFRTNLLMIIIFSFPYLMVLLGFFYSENKTEVLKIIQLQVPLLAFPLVFGTARLNWPVFMDRILRILPYAVVSGCLFCIIRGLWYLVTGSNWAYLYGYEMNGLKNMSPYILGLSCVLSIWIQYSFLRKAQPTRTKFFQKSTIVFLVVFVFLLSNRIAALLLVGSAICVVINNLSTIRQRVLAIVALLALPATAFFLNPAARQQWNDLIDTSASNQIKLDVDSSQGRAWGGKAIRVAILRCSGDLVKNHWVTGVGAGDVQDSLQQAYENRKFYFASMYNRYNAHNQYLQNLLGSGILSTLALLAALIMPATNLYRRPKSFLYFYFLTSVFVICFTESIFETNKGITYYSLLNSIFAFGIIHLKPDPKNSKSVHDKQQSKI